LTQDRLDVPDNGLLRARVIVHAASEKDLQQRLHPRPVGHGELHHALDVGPQHRRGARFSAHPLRHVRPDRGDRILGDRRDQLVLAHEVVGDQPGARQARPLGDPGERCLPETELGDHLDGRRHDLRPPRRRGHRSSRATIHSYWHE